MDLIFKETLRVIYNYKFKFRMTTRQNDGSDVFYIAEHCFVESEHDEKDCSEIISHPSETFLQRIKLILKLAIPSSLSMLGVSLIEMINLSFIGHLNDELLIGGVGIGNMVQNIFAISIIYGFNSVLDTLISQAAGAGNTEMCGVYLHRGRFIITCLYLPMCLILMNCEPALVWLGQDPQVSAYAQQYIISFLPGLLILNLNDCQKRLLNNFGKNSIVFYSTAISLILHGVWCHIFVVNLELGIVGTGLANIMSQLVQFAFLMYCTSQQEDLQEVLIMPDARVFKGLKDYVKMAIPLTVMIVFDWWVWNLMVLVSAYFGTTEQAANIIIMNVVNSAFLIANGIDQAACTIIGQWIGNGNNFKAKKYYQSLKIFTTVVVAFSSLFMFAFRHSIIGVFTNNADVQHTAVSVMWMIALAFFPDGYGGMLVGVVKSLGLQKQCVILNIVGHTIIGTSMQWYFGFQLGLGLVGMWFGRLILNIFIAVSYTVLIQVQDWKAIISASKQRQSKESKIHF